ncbi:enoyl-CoA hydratase-related protein [Lachnospiraceae bacterium ZAX-1]
MGANILTNIEGQIAVVTVNRPKSLNSLILECFSELADAFDACDKNEAVRAIVVTGAGKNFSSGGDLDMFQDFLDNGYTFEQANSDVIEASRMAIAMRQCKKPIVAAISGACFGAGLSLALACDFRVIDPNVKMSTAFVNIGFSGDTGCIFALEKMLGIAKMTELMMLGSVLDAEQIMGLGLASKMSEEGKSYETARGMALKLAKGPTATYGLQKALIWEYFFKDYDAYSKIEAKYMGLSTQKQDFAEAISAFLEKRKPNFVGK